MKLIDAEKLIEDGYSLERTYRKDSSTMVVERCKIEDIPVVDAVPVVRCRDCKYGAQDDFGGWFCVSFYCTVGNDDGSGFCADGERREE